MSRRAAFIPYQPKTILNKSKRADHWFWTRYSAYPYIGCQHGCEFCYCRERKYSPYENPEDFAYVIKVKENAPDLLRQALSRAPVDMIFTGDYQPAERKYELSRRILEVCYELGFPVFILERSPLVLRDLDLIQSIHQRARAVVAFSIITTPESTAYELVRRMERLAPTPEKRFQAMEKLARAGIPTGICFMPILPGLCDDYANLEAVVRWTANHGGQFVLASSLTLADQQRDYFFGLLSQRFPDLLPLYKKLYTTGGYTPSAYNWKEIALTIREACTRHGISDRMPRPIIPGDQRTLNRKIVEQLADQVYTLELQDQPAYKIWAFRKAAWAIEDLEQDLDLVYNRMGLKGLESIPDVGPSLSKKIEKLMVEAKNSLSKETKI
jgi:DNA repair photolyase